MVNKQTGKSTSRTSIGRKQQDLFNRWMLQQEERKDENNNCMNHQTKPDEQTLRHDQ